MMQRTKISHSAVKALVKGTLAWIPAVLLCSSLSSPEATTSIPVIHTPWAEPKQDTKTPLHYKMWGHALWDKINQSLSLAIPATMLFFSLYTESSEMDSEQFPCSFTAWASDPVTTQKIMGNYPLIAGDVVEWIWILKSSLKLGEKKCQTLPCTRTLNTHVSERLTEQLLQLSISINEMKFLCCICGSCGSRLSWCLMRARTESMKLLPFFFFLIY